jgi:hypothetical protein
LDLFIRNIKGVHLVGKGLKRVILAIVHVKKHHMLGHVLAFGLVQIEIFKKGIDISHLGTYSFRLGQTNSEYFYVLWCVLWI